MAFTDVITPTLADTPGAFQHQLERRVPAGLIEFEQAPIGFTKLDGERRRADWRAYFWTPNAAECEPCGSTGREPGARPNTTRKCGACDGTGDTSKRTRVPSVTTLLDTILPKPGLPPWAEARGIEGAIEAIEKGIIPWRASMVDGEIDVVAVGLDPDAAANAVDLVRANRLGADRARDDAASRGLNVHALLQTYMETGQLPVPSDHPAEHQGYVAALIDFLETVRPEPVAVEELVCDPAYGYAGRYDLCAKVDGQVGLFDAKTSEKAQIFPGAHLQIALYARAALACGDGEVDFTRVVVFGADGDWRQMNGAANDRLVDAALEFARLLRPVSSVCESKNRAEREARKAVAA